MGVLDKDDKEVQFLFPSEFIEVVADIVRDLVAAFDTLVRVYCRNHSLSGMYIPTVSIGANLVFSMIVSLISLPSLFVITMRPLLLSIL